MKQARNKQFYQEKIKQLNFSEESDEQPNYNPLRLI